ncbi:hypothetical protein [Rhodococcus sp. 1168]|uniref:hypothetical protein n=1 Tax=Rhodococcus sp. 1168 TaxID=2018041 RepID=UPI000F7421D9|nr:hypothetical protein [Rhodococcus sp. 1168]
MSPHTWIENKVDVFLDEATAHGLNAYRTAVAALIDTAVTRAAIRAGVTHRAAQKNYSDDDVRALVRGAADSLAAEAPGTQLADLRPTHTVPVALAGRTASGLAILTELAASAAGPDRRELLHGLNQTLSLITEWGVVIEEAATAHQHHVAVPEAAIHRTIREFERGGYHLAAGIAPVDGGDPDSLAQAFDHNIAELRREL